MTRQELRWIQVSETFWQTSNNAYYVRELPDGNWVVAAFMWDGMYIDTKPNIAQAMAAVQGFRDQG